MSNRYRVTTLVLSGVNISIDNNDASSFLCHDGSFKNVSSGLVNSGNLQSTGQTLYGYITNTSGNLDTRLYQTGSNLLALITAASAGVSSISVTGHAAQSGNLNFSGLGGLVVSTGANNFIYFSGSATAVADHGDGINLSGNLTTTGQTLYNDIIGLSGLLSGNLTTTGQNLYTYITNTSGNLDSRLYSTGSNIYNLINNFSGVFNNSGTQYQNQINTLTTNLTTTGVNIYTSISSLSGWVNNTSRISNISVTGFPAYTGNVNISGAGNVIVFTGTNNLILISGTGGGGGQGTTNNYFVNSGSGTYLFRSSISGNAPVQFINFPVSLSADAFIVTTMRNDYDNTVLPLQISGRTTSGFWTIFPNITNNTGYYIDTLASNYTNTGLATTVIINNGGSNSDGINLSGNLTITGQTLYKYINDFSGIFNNSGSQYQSQINTLTNNLTTTGVNLGTSINSLSGWVNNTSRVSSISVTGFGGQTGSIKISGLGTITTFTGTNNFIYISGSATAGAGEANTASNLGVGYGLFNQKVGVDLQFNSVTGGSGINVSKSGSTYLINSTLPMAIPFSTNSITITNMAAALNFFNSSNVTSITKADLSPFSYIQLSSRVSVTGTATGWLQVSYLDHFSTTASDYITIDANATKTRFDTAGVTNSGWQPLVEGSKSGVYLALLQIGGNGVGDPVFGNIYAFFK